MEGINTYILLLPITYLCRHQAGNMEKQRTKYNRQQVNYLGNLPTYISVYTGKLVFCMAILVKFGHSSRTSPVPGLNHGPLTTPKTL